MKVLDEYIQLEMRRVEISNICQFSCYYYIAKKKHNNKGDCKCNEKK